jgi:trehalose/maltose hydrolase-like predicted phosphorylase
MEIAKDRLNTAYQKGFDQLEKEHVEACAERWKAVDLKNENDLAKQMQSRFDQFRRFHGSPFEEAVPFDIELPEWLM